MTMEHIHIAGNDPKWNMPYTPALKVTGGSLVFASGVTAAPVYHSHPHVPAEESDCLIPNSDPQLIEWAAMSPELEFPFPADES